VRRERLRWSASLLAALGLHGAIAAGLAIAVVGDDRAAPQPAVLLDLPPEPDLPAARPEPPPAEPSPAEPPAPVVPLRPKPARKVEAARPPVPPVPAESRAADEMPREATAAAASAPRASDPPPQPAAGASVPPSWIGKLMARLERYKRYPSAARAAHEQGTVYLRFAIDREGRVLRARVDRSSGVAALDQESLDLLERADPLPPPPDEVRGDPVELVVPIEFTLHRS
jgi:protein TonB